MVNINKHYPGDQPVVTQDNLILEHYGLNELNFESIKSYRQKFQTAKPNHPWNGLEIKEFLYKIGAWGKLRNTSKEGLTLAGLLMFSEERIISEVLPQYFLEYRESTDGIPSEGWSNRFTSQDGTWSGNVYDFYFKTMQDLTGDITDSPKVDGELVHACLHEALVNALVHADYYGEGGIVIEKEKMIFRFSNPGLLRTPTEQALEGRISNLRNPNIFKMFILINFCKRAGSGLKKIESVWSIYNWDEPDLMQDTQLNRTILTLDRQSTIDKQQYRSNDTFVNEEYDYFDIEMSKKTDSINKNTNSYNKELDSYNKEFESVNNELDSVNKGINSINKETNSLNKEKNPCNKERNSVNKGVDSMNNEEPLFNMTDELEEDNQDVNLIPDDVELGMQEMAANIENDESLDHKLWTISEVARKKRRLSPRVLEGIILSLLEVKPLMLKELAHLLERTPDGLRNNYLGKLLNEDKIQLKYPNQINHPKQAYIIGR
ncbi:ATP-binding protein [Bacillus sp. 165]|uniref:ATP-binding protein n=1 Tax=Bacillus sp. 165 TaxID=1529117 RepID=UPI001ADBAF3C|nr:ATP-binding protein [Bacillus sp. 165]MBO9130158.1 transcriptional regulator [Bacillus sp. 165]